jgi:hypothetical protein
MKLITQNFKTHAARQFVESFGESANTIYYVTGHKSTPFTNDSSPPNPENTQNYHYELYDDVIFGKHVTPADVKHMIRNITWVSGTVYDIYDDLEVDLENKNFFVSSLESGSYHIFKCLFNNNGSASTDQPLFSEIDTNDEIYKTTDSYQWKYMYSISASEYLKFATSEYIPVIENTDVTDSAVSGAINSIIVTNPGGQYNSYAYGTVKESAVAGNTLLYSLNGEKFTDFLVTVPDITGFIEERVTSLNANGKTASGVIVARYAANNTFRVTSTVRNFIAGRTIVGVTSNTSQTISTSTKITAELSSNTDFYKNNSFYIRSGTGAGQLRTIVKYDVPGEERRVLLNSPLSVYPDATSIFEIGPRVIISGDGQNANAVVTIDPAANSIAEVEIINSGTNYTYADIQIIANTGLLDITTGLTINTTTAQTRAIISPPGGHGSNVINELYANKVGIGMSFANTESGTISVENDFRKISVLKDPLFANVELTLASSVSTSFTAGETVLQANTGATGIVTNRDGTSLRLTDVRGFFESGNSTVNFVTGQSSSFEASVDSVDKSVETFDQRQIYQVETPYIYSGTTGSGFIEDELVIQKTQGFAQVGSDIIRLTIDNSAYVYSEGEVITQTKEANTFATGIISARYDSVITLTDTTGNFETGNSTVNYITGGTSNVVSSVLSTDNTFEAVAIAYIHSLNNGANSDVVGLTNVRGFFSVSDDVSGAINTIVGQTSKAEAKLKARSYSRNYLVDNSGEFLYTENFTPVARDVDQTEKVKLIIEF